ncbi:uncharacterized protein LOC141608342 [Silene latifolia]|uniref:uncharacterized protein LOC141608342 n=1 Tax=Silene latifolia TaxID=37657 RepID=UPI003D78242A
MLSQTLVKGYNRANISPRCMIKVDIRKAFDSLQWSFIANMLSGLGFPQQFIGWVLGCIQTPWYYLKINGELSGFFQGKIGIRHGDPLSPYLFMLSMEVLSRYLRTLCGKPLVSYHPKCSRLKLNHLIFADDLMVFVRGDVPFVAAVKSTLSLFAELSGLHANIEKTNIYFGGVHPDVKGVMLAATGFSDGQFPFRYLGVPLSTSRVSVTMFDSLILKIKHSIQHWSSHFLTYAGRVQLINSIIFGMENFWCSCNLLPQEVLHKINKLLQMAFLLAHTTVGSWVSWHQAYILQHQSIWFVQSQDSFSSSLKGILTVRDRLVALAGSITNASSLINSWCSHGKFRVTAAYSYLRGTVLAGPWTKALTHPRIVPSHTIICSLAAQKKLATVDNMQHRGLYMVNRCSLCEVPLEDHAHFFFNCSFSKDIWQRLLHWMGINRAGSCLLAELKQAGVGSKQNWRMAWFCTSLAAAVYQVWNERNSRCRYLISAPPAKHPVIIGQHVWIEDLVELATNIVAHATWQGKVNGMQAAIEGSLTIQDLEKEERQLKTFFPVALDLSLLMPEISEVNSPVAAEDVAIEEVVPVQEAADKEVVAEDAAGSGPIPEKESKPETVGEEVVSCSESSTLTAVFLFVETQKAIVSTQRADLDLDGCRVYSGDRFILGWLSCLPRVQI